jgi:hypothetical protein
MAFRAKISEDASKQERGELIEPLKPIVYTLTGYSSGKFIKQGIDDWQIAFENAGWKMRFEGDIGQKMIQQ